jgi:predicted type IV restriction endonuclease
MGTHMTTAQQIITAVKTEDAEDERITVIMKAVSG